MTDQPSNLQVRSEETTNTKQGTPDSPTAAKKCLVLAARAEKLTITGAARTAGVHRDTIYAWRAADPEFARALDDAHTEAVDVLKESVYERAFKDPILAMFVIKANDPQYNDKVQAARAFAEAQANNPMAALAGEIRDLIGGLIAAGVTPRRRGDARTIVVEAQALPTAQSTGDTDQQRTT